MLKPQSFWVSCLVYNRHIDHICLGCNRHIDHICLEHSRCSEWAILIERFESELVVAQRGIQVEVEDSCCRSYGDCGPGHLSASLLPQLDIKVICDLEASLSLDVVDGKRLTLLDVNRG